MADAPFPLSQTTPSPPLPSHRHDGGGGPAVAAPGRPQGPEFSGPGLVPRRSLPGAGPGREGGGERRRAAPPPSPPNPSSPPKFRVGLPRPPRISGGTPKIWGGLLPEPRLEELGLGGFTPVGLIQNLLELLHLELGLPWWGAIAAGTVGVRLLLLPLVLRGQREAARLAQHLPHIQKLNQRLAEAKRQQNHHGVALAYTELVTYQKKHNVNPLRGFLVPLVQTPVFVSFFLALQGLAAAPAPGLLRGGLGWFQDLSASDPYYVLPLLVTASTWMVLELGAETGVATPGGGAVRQLLRLLPLLFLPFILHFPTAVFTYWLTSNSFSLLQTALLRVPALRARVGVAPPLAPPTGPAQRGKGGFLQRLKKEWEEANVTQRAEQRQRQLRDHLSLAGKGPLRQTFAQNPLSPPGGVPATPRPPKQPWRDTLG
ncbi:mitochondrial inner membrane protein OXA1L [Manacus candei]|uniref:mitochondrial inner membrane protein OXA1L n=1 Tax=Manacus candei TaxID=415023 RepID=UPI00222720EF|nr:mitochondrial inner membrane protein OXA1L [Manacus candei]